MLSTVPWRFSEDKILKKIRITIMSDNTMRPINEIIAKKRNKLCLVSMTFKVNSSRG